MNIKQIMQYVCCFILQTTLMNVLTHIASFGTIVQRLQAFVDETTKPCAQGFSQTNENDGTTPPGVCQTYQAFAAAMSEYLREMKKEITKLEQDICKQGWLDLPFTKSA